RYGINSRNNNILDKIDNNPHDYVDGEPDPEPEPDPDPDPDPDPEPEKPKPEIPDIEMNGINNYFKDFINGLIENIEKMLIVNLFDYGKSRTFGNSFLKVDKTFSNTYKIKPTLNFNNIIDDTVKDGTEEMEKIVSDTIKNIKDTI